MADMWLEKIRAHELRNSDVPPGIELITVQAAKHTSSHVPINIETIYGRCYDPVREGDILLRNAITLPFPINMGRLMQEQKSYGDSYQEVSNLANFFRSFKDSRYKDKMGVLIADESFIYLFREGKRD